MSLENKLKNKRFSLKELLNRGFINKGLCRLDLSMPLMPQYEKDGKCYVFQRKRGKLIFYSMR